MRGVVVGSEMDCATGRAARRRIEVASDCRALRRGDLESRDVAVCPMDSRGRINCGPRCASGGGDAAGDEPHYIGLLGTAATPIT